MKQLATLVICLAAGAALAQEPAQKARPALRPEITAAQAVKDIQEGHYRFYTYGLISMANSKAADILNKEYNIQVSGAAGCVVTNDLVNRVRAYNEAMDKAVFKKYGKTYSQLLAEARQKVQQAGSVAPLKS